MKVLTLHKIMLSYDGIRFGLIHFLNPKSIEKIYEDNIFDPRKNENIPVTAIEDKRGKITFVEENVTTVVDAITEAKKW